MKTSKIRSRAPSPRDGPPAPARDGEERSPARNRWSAVEAAILALLVGNSVAYVWLSGTFHENATRMIWCADEVTVPLLEGRLLEWLGSQTYYPPLYHLFMGLCPFGTRLISLPAMVLWSDLLMAAGFAGLAASLRPHHPATGAAALSLLLGFPLVNAFAKAPHFEAGLLAFTSALLALLCTSGELPGLAGCVALGVLAGSAILCKWTAVLYITGPLLVAAWFTSRRPDGARPALAGLATLGLVALLLTGPWFWWCMDWERFGATLANTPTTPDVAGFAGYRSRFGLGLDYLSASIGGSLIPLVAAGCWLAFRRTPRVATLLAASVALPIAVLPVFQHIEIRYVAPVLPALAALAGLGIAGASPSWRPLLLALLLVLAPAQAIDRTWMGALLPCPDFGPGPQDNFDGRLQMSWSSSETARSVVERCGHWAGRLRRGRGWMRFAGHPLEVFPGLKPTVFVTLQRRDGILRNPLLFVDYAPHDYKSFVDELRDDRLDFLVLSQQTLAADPGQVREAVLSVWTYVPQGGEHSPNTEPPPLADPLALERIRANFGVVETLRGECGPVWLLVRRSLWDRQEAPPPLTPLPPTRRAE